MHDLAFDTRFVVKPSARKAFLCRWIMVMTVQDLKDIMNCADKLQVSEYCTRPTVDVLHDIAEKLTLFEQEIVEPKDLMDRIRAYLKSN